MGFIEVVKSTFLPACIAATIYAFLAYLLVPFYRNYRNRYSQYLPLDNLNARTADFRGRLVERVQTFLLPSHIRWRREIADGRFAAADEPCFGEEEGENMVGFDVDGRMRTVDRGQGVDSQRRLSRDLEEGFQDESEDESGDDRRR